MQAMVLNKRSVLDEHRTTKLYTAARALWFSQQLTVQQQQDQTIWRSRFITTEGMVVSTCTDVETGMFVQLAGPSAGRDEDLMLVFGQKFCQEGKDIARQNIATKMWS